MESLCIEVSEQLVSFVLGAEEARIANALPAVCSIVATISVAAWSLFLLLQTDA
jgi:hypothetical protein